MANSSEGQHSTVKFKKDTKVKVIRAYTEQIETLQGYYDEYSALPDEESQHLAQVAKNEIYRLHKAVGRTFVIHEHCSGANPHVVTVDGVKLGFPADCLEEVKEN